MTKKVFVSGCYDMLHSGHVAFFEEAASHGDLYVGLGSDKTIIRLKGRKTIKSYKNEVLGWKISGAGGGGYLVLVSEKRVENAMQVKIRR